MATLDERFDMIANQMMKGGVDNIKAIVPATKEEIEKFRETHHDLIKYLIDALPKEISTAVVGAIGKAVLWYGLEKMEPFIHAMNKRNYNGIRDPVHVLWHWLIRQNTTRNNNTAYRRTITAIRFYLKGKDVPYNLRPANDDIFEWQNNYTKMAKLRGQAIYEASMKG